jgi:hypothetical protein
VRSPGSPSGPPNSRFSVDAFLVDHAGVSKAVIGSVGGGGAIHIGRPLVGQLHFATESLRADGWSSDVPHLRVVGVDTSELGSGHSPGLYRLDQTRWTPWSDVRVNVAVCVQACIAIRQVYVLQACRPSGSAPIVGAARPHGNQETGQNCRVQWVVDRVGLRLAETVQRRNPISRNVSTTTPTQPTPQRVRTSRHAICPCAGPLGHRCPH